MSAQKQEFLYEGKAKIIFSTSDPQLYLADYKDDALNEPLMNDYLVLAPGTTITTSTPG